MGALTMTSDRKRAFTDQFQCSSSMRNLEYSKKSKISNSLMNLKSDKGVSLGSYSSRLNQYPEVTKGIDREVHAPTKFGKFGLSAKKEESGGEGEMGNLLSRNYSLAKNEAFKTLRFLKGEEEEEVIDVDLESGSGNEIGGLEVIDVPDDEVEELRKKEKKVIGENDGYKSLQFVKEKEVIDVDLESGSRDENVGLQGDSCLEVIEVPEDEVELRKGRKESAEKFRELGGNVRVVENPCSSSAGATGLTDGELGEFWNVDTSIPVYKKLYLAITKKFGKLNRIRNEIIVEEKLLAKYQSLRPAKKQEDVTNEVLLPLSEDEEKEVTYALFHAARTKALVTHENSNIQITGELLRCLRPKQWLNDEVINVYLELLKEREKREPKKYLKCHFFNTFFYKKLIGGSSYDYKSVRRWTTQRKLGYCLHECDKIFVPVHKEVHWCLAVINMKDKKFQYLDSLGGVDRQIMKVLAQYIVDEVKDKSGKDIDVTIWKQEFVKDLPYQENGFDCGMFMIKYVDFYSRDIGLCFKQEHMSYFRRRTAKEILRLKAD